MSSVEKLELLKRALIWACLDGKAKIRGVRARKFILDRRQLKALIRQTLGITSRLSVYSWLDALLAYGLVTKNPHETRDHKPTNQTIYIIEEIKPRQRRYVN